MGHYLSEMESPDEADRRMAEASAMRSRQDRGYWSPGVRGPREMLHHLPCGLAVFDPEKHDETCPAKEK